MLCCVSLSAVSDFVTPWTVAHQAPLSMGLLRQEYSSGLPFPSPGYLPNTGIEPRCPAWQGDSLASESPGKPMRRWLRRWWRPHLKLTFSKMLISTRGETRGNKELPPLLWREERSRAQQGQNLERRGGVGQREADGGFVRSQKSSREQRGHVSWQRWWRQPRRSRIRLSLRTRDHVSPSLHALPSRTFREKPLSRGAVSKLQAPESCPWTQQREPLTSLGQDSTLASLVQPHACASFYLLPPEGRPAHLVRIWSRGPCTSSFHTLHPRDLSFGLSLHVAPSFLSVSIVDLPHPCLLPLDWQVPTATLGFPAGSAGKESTCHVGDLGSIPGLGRCPGEGKRYPLQYSGLENSMDRGAWWAVVHGVSESQIWLTNTHTCPPTFSDC